MFALNVIKLYSVPLNVLQLNELRKRRLKRIILSELKYLLVHIQKVNLSIILIDK